MYEYVNKNVLVSNQLIYEPFKIASIIKGDESG